jgi:uncharacterized protein YggE
MSPHDAAELVSSGIEVLPSDALQSGHKGARTMPRSTLRVLCLAGLGVLTASTGRPEDEAVSRRSRITVTGDAEVKVAPDQAVLRMQVVTRHQSLLIAKTTNDDGVRASLELIRKMGVKPEDAQTSALQIERREVQRSGESPLFLGYEVRKSISVVLDDLGRADALLTAVIKAGVNRIEGLDLRCSDIRKHKDRARALAIRAAREKAVALTAEISQTIGKAIEISEEPERGWVLNSNSIEISNASGSDEGTFARGQNSVRARVSVAFALQ